MMYAENREKENEMKMQEALKIARQIAKGRCTVSSHYGESRRKDRAVKISGCFQRDAGPIAAEIAEALNGNVVIAAGFAAVWL
jgi:hypothetical protein